LDDSAIGVFDSGIGDLSIVFELNKLLPNKNIEYFAEHPRQSYRPRKKQEIEGFVIEIINYLISKEIKVCIIGVILQQQLALKKHRHILIFLLLV